MDAQYFQKVTDVKDRSVKGIIAVLWRFTTWEKEGQIRTGRGLKATKKKSSAADFIA